MRLLGKVLLSLAFGTALFGITDAQSRYQLTGGAESCVTNEDIQKMQTQLRDAKEPVPNDAFLAELKKQRTDSITRFQRNLAQAVDKNAFALKSNIDEKTETDLCTALKTYGWPTISSVGNEGAEDGLFLLKNSGLRLQIAMLPVLAEAVKKREVLQNEAYAAFIDRLRLQTGRRQLFGTQASFSDDFLVLDPIEDEANVDTRRQAYGMQPLSQYIKSLELLYQIPMIRSPKLPAKPADPAAAIQDKAGKELLNANTPAGDEDVIRIDTNIVNLDVSVYAPAVHATVGNFEQNDFKLFEDGKEEKITYFSKTDVPFDLVLLLDISGSTSEKTGLIKKSTTRFINAARPADRLAIVTFADYVEVLSPLTSDHDQLLSSAKKIKGTGFSRVWDALQYTLDKILGPKTPDRRRAVVFMTDGADSSMMYYKGFGSHTSFADLLETVRNSETAIIPIYLDTEATESNSKNLYQKSRATLQKLADESGGLFYRADKLEDLNGVYEQVLNDLGKVYSIGYVPSNEKRDGQWRTVKVQIPSRSDVVVHTRAGYYAN
jgi:Ca-activated chloride channel family protein